MSDDAKKKLVARLRAGSSPQLETFALDFLVQNLAAMLIKEFKAGKHIVITVDGKTLWDMKGGADER